ncbi:ABC transporter permease [Demequina lignilytica]|uniref:ABC transporter permease n=1 Tax=Demequina lignilytica TaxID=3051663 RepID=A0AAW7M0U8_9MICO|nr:MULTISPECIES: ABC transporter permease [unclassified Demequina]MDN4477641.1 ABC transporter permease [Demequina sp. SYSU T00039-1]MDN4483685.1 ABC transporter permease [Demequina sp. SYSU T0a273]MDN4488008.1 ABC transporter permease [Demequina sp. SYSU T00039]MDN4490448.1 ABC transporter permease [Demequina sp. SYSU T00068]
MSDRITEHYVAPSDPNEGGEVDKVRLSDRKSNLWLDAWRDLRRRPLFYIAIAIVAVVSLAALFPSLFTDTLPNNDCQLANSNGAPTEGHPLGFTRQGCDVYARIVYGASTSLSVGLLVVLITAVIGIPMGALAAFYGGWIDSVLSRVGDIFFAIPYFLAAVVVMSVMPQRNVLVISLAIGGFAWASLARILRAEVLQVKNLEYVMASEAMGRSKFSTLVRHVLPNSLTPVIVYLTIALGAAITAEATLSFLGIGLGSSTMSWGNDIAQAQSSIRVAPMALFWPSLALTVTVLAFIILGELIRDALDPKARARR